MPDPNSENRLISTGIWYLEDPMRFKVFQDATVKTAIESGIGLRGRLPATRQPVWILDLAEDTGLPGTPVAQALGLRSGIALPVSSGSRVVAFLEFFDVDPK